MKKVFSASITPLNADGTLDRTGLQRLFERNLRHGLDGVFLLGTMGEWNYFDLDFRLELIEQSCRIIRQRIELLVGITAPSLNLALANLKAYSQFDFSGYVFMLSPKPNELNPVKSILTVLDAADRPVWLYYYPGSNGLALSLDDFAEIMSHPNLRGLKNSASDMRIRRELILLKRERGLSPLLLEGNEWSVDEAMISGYDGILCGSGALTSKLLVEVARTVDDGNIGRAIDLQNRLIEIFHGVYGINLSNVWNGQKYALYRLGLIASPLTLAQDPDTLTPAARKRVDECLEKFQADLD